jgi:hypothetical protein
VPGEGESVFDIVAKFPGSGLVTGTLARPFPLPDGTTGNDLYIKPSLFRKVFAADVMKLILRAAKRVG